MVEYTHVQDLNHRKKMKVENSRLIPRKHRTNLLFVHSSNKLPKLSHLGALPPQFPFAFLFQGTTRSLHISRSGLLPEAETYGSGQDARQSTWAQGRADQVGQMMSSCQCCN